MDRWYTWVENRMYGPYQPEQLAEFIQPGTMLCREGSQDWKAAKDYPELSFLLHGIPLDLSPNVGWLVRHSGSDAVDGPFPKAKISEMIAAGQLTPDDEIKHTDWDEWEKVGETKLVTQRESVETPENLPNPEGFQKVVRDSSDEELLKEYSEKYAHYERREKKILKEELLRRGLIERFGLF